MLALFLLLALVVSLTALVAFVFVLVVD